MRFSPGIHVAVLTAVVANNVLGFLLHAPFSFMDPWARALRGTPETLGEPSPTALALGVAGSIALFYSIAWLLTRLEVDSAREGLGISVGLAFAVLVPATAVQYAFAGFGMAAVLVDGGQQVASLALGGLLVGAAVARRPAPGSLAVAAARP